MTDEMETLDPEAIAAARAQVAPMKVKAEKGKRGQSAEWMREMARRRAELAKVDPASRGGRPRTKLTRKEIEERAFERMMPKALKVLEEQLTSPDERVRQSAAVKVMEYVKGKPTQNINQHTDQVTRVVYESAAWDPTAVVVDAEIEQAPLLELPPADDAA